MARALCDPRLVSLAGAGPRAIRFLRAQEVRPNLGLGAQVLLDEVVLAVLKDPRLFPDARDLQEAGSEVGEAHRMWTERGWIDSPETYHVAPQGTPRVALVRDRVRRLDLDVATWNSGYQPHRGEPGRQRWLQQAHHRTARATLLRHREPGRPWLICVHGFGMGQPAMDIGFFEAVRLRDTLGVNVALPVLPAHGSRQHPSLRPGEGFTSANILDGIHGVAQAVLEIRSLMRWIREVEPTAPIGIHGVSLGACVASVVASVEPSLSCVIAGIPVSDLFELYRRSSPPPLARQAVEAGAQGRQADEIARVVSPLHLSPLVAHRHRYVIAGRGDRMSTGAQAAALWEHWDRPTIDWFPGGHIGYFLSRRARREVHTAVQRSLLGPQSVARRATTA